MDVNEWGWLGLLKKTPCCKMSWSGRCSIGNDGTLGNARPLLVVHGIHIDGGFHYVPDFAVGGEYMATTFLFLETYEWG